MSRRRRYDNNNWQNQRQYKWETQNQRLRSGSTSSLGSLNDENDNTSGIRFTTQNSLYNLNVTLRVHQSDQRRNSQRRDQSSQSKEPGNAQNLIPLGQRGSTFNYDDFVRSLQAGLSSIPPVPPKFPATATATATGSSLPNPLSPSRPPSSIPVTNIPYAPYKTSQGPQFQGPRFQSSSPSAGFSSRFIPLPSKSGHAGVPYWMPRNRLVEMQVGLPKSYASYQKKKKGKDKYSQIETHQEYIRWMRQKDDVSISKMKFQFETKSHGSRNKVFAYKRNVQDISDVFLLPITYETGYQRRWSYMIELVRPFGQSISSADTSYVLFALLLSREEVMNKNQADVLGTLSANYFNRPNGTFQLRSIYIKFLRWTKEQVRDYVRQDFEGELPIILDHFKRQHFVTKMIQY